MIEVRDLCVPAEHPVVPGVPVDPGADIPGLAVIAVDIGSPQIRLEGPWNDHRRGLQLEAPVPLIGHDAGARALEPVELAYVIFALERITLVLDAAIERGHLVAHLVDRDPRSENEGREYDRAVRKPDLRIVDVIGARLALFVLGAARVVQPEPGSDLLVVLEITEPLAELSRGRFPHQRRREGVEMVVELSRAYPEGAQVVADHHLVAQIRSQVSLDPEAARIGRAEELIRHQAVVDAQPEWEVAFRGAHTRE